MTAAARTSSPARTYQPGRLLAFSDGVFAIAITLLILPLADLELSPDDLGAQLLASIPRMVTFALGFLVIGLYWMSHHAWFSRVRAVDDQLIKINLGLLLCVAFLPFPTAVLASHGGTAGTVFYAGAVALTGLMFALTWSYLLRHPELLEADSTAALRRHTLVGLISPIVFAASIPVALFTADGSKLVWLLIWPASALTAKLADSRIRPS